jgi:hypothetical protein
VERTTLEDLLRIARSDLGAQAVIELDQELVISLECPNCHTMEQVLRPLSQITFEAGHCPTCGTLRDAQFSHVITWEENFLHRTLSSVGVPPLLILRAQNGIEYRFYELTGDLPEALHFRHFEQNNSEKTQPLNERIRLKGELQLPDSAMSSPRIHIHLKQEPSNSTVVIKPEASPIQIKKNKKDKINFSTPGTPKNIRYMSPGRSARIISKLGRGRVKVCKV